MVTRLLYFLLYYLLAFSQVFMVTAVSILVIAYVVLIAVLYKRNFQLDLCRRELVYCVLML